MDGVQGCFAEHTRILTRLPPAGASVNVSAGVGADARAMADDRFSGYMQEHLKYCACVASWNVGSGSLSQGRHKGFLGAWIRNPEQNPTSCNRKTSGTNREICHCQILRSESWRWAAKPWCQKAPDCPYSTHTAKVIEAFEKDLARNSLDKGQKQFGTP